MTINTPHGGVLVPLPAGVGQVEILRRDATDHPGQSRLFAYYLDTNSKPISPAPTVATWKFRSRGIPPVSLKPTGDASPAKAGELASPDIDFQGDYSGELSATVGGKLVAVTISIR